ncbi:Short-chain dehydrogenase [Kitasatospora sp. MMS16-BH015]|uniref:SDR family NAD(P)-dependent oxidoreductase n=1 Tax=Kitasatospora sp. MMS16-BH015 TaxID=2018025 RepID=UPI000CA11F3B|nr:SDR family NAD(P)-dependent oxidoreductase [Kitasatospora sp. MMS16-BH015]AUG75893.1 Short-chain dehydrogenase [Kitasatospora sp. MMS16-BH015]
MEYDGWRLMVAGATGVIGGAVAAAAAERGAAVVVAGRDPVRLDAVARRVGAAGQEAFDAYDLERCGELAAGAARAMGGLDAVLVAFGVAAFGRAGQVPLPVQEHLMAVNASAPMAVLEGALGVVAAPGAIGALTGVVVERPVAGTTAYRAAKAALAAWLESVRAEHRRTGLTVLDARLPHLETGFSRRALVGEPPPLPPGADLETWVLAVLDGLRQGAAVIRPGGVHGAPVSERATRGGADR